MNRIMTFAIALCCTFGFACKSSSSETVNGETYDILIVNMTMTGETHYVRSAEVVASRIPLRIRTPALEAIHYVVTDSDHRSIASGGLDDPRVKRGPMALPGEKEIGHATVLVDTVDYVIRIPYMSGIRFLKLTRKDSNAARTGTGKPEISEQTIDLSPFLND